MEIQIIFTTPHSVEEMSENFFDIHIRIAAIITIWVVRAELEQYADER